MERYVPKSKGSSYKYIIIILVLAVLFLIIRNTSLYDKIRNIFGGKPTATSQGQAQGNTRTERRLISLNSYRIENYPADKVKHIKLSDWKYLVNNIVKLNYSPATYKSIFINNIYDIVPRWCYIIGDVITVKKDNKYFLILDIRTPDVVHFKFKGIEQIYRSNSPTVSDINIKAKFYGMNNVLKPAVFTNNGTITLKRNSQQPSKRIKIEIDPTKIKGFKFLIIELKDIGYFVFK